MALHGRVKNGVVVLDGPEELPEGTVVELRPVPPSGQSHHPEVERFAGVIENDLAVREEYFEHLRKKHQ